MTTNENIKRAISREADWECLKRIESEAIKFYLENDYAVVRSDTIISEVLPRSEEVKRLFEKAGVSSGPDSYQALMSLLDKKRIAVQIWRKRNKRLTLSHAVDEMIAYLTYQGLSGAIGQRDNDSVVEARCERGIRAMRYLNCWYDIIKDAKAKAYEALERECRTSGDVVSSLESKRSIFAYALAKALYENICNDILHLKKDEVVTTCGGGFGAESALTDIVWFIIRKDADVIASDNATFNEASDK